MGHYCRICGRERPNEQFSGKGHRIHVCKRCKAMPKSKRQVIENLDPFVLVAASVTKRQRRADCWGGFAKRGSE